ncbi:80 kD MCM3-associated protein [Penicillium malachiteum]|uniref:80 kD MCM3-associated protein n=1 Tax=Penicillium malachiteum TaxID=1324776 RepID=UPI0025467721|nr:80 kD MCM3-associated protein [Penicillium malachiteum]KAJ5735687.1 80 kD MCM3-associated protein [Penicillium malachiteum]
MATPFNPFGGRGQRGATISAPTSSRGRGVPSGRGAPAHRGTQFQPRGSLSSIPRGTTSTSRARGLPQPRGRGRGRARGSVAPPHAGASHPGTTESHAQPQATASHFNQVNEKKPSPNPFGGFNTEPKPSISGFSKVPVSQTSSFNPQTAPFNPQNAKKQNGTIDLDTEMEPSAAKKLDIRYEQLKLDRAKQRLLAIRDGQMADPQKPTSLNNAITPVGTCDTMCPDFERVERIVQKMVDKSEKSLDPVKGTLETVELKMLKRFRRSAAGYDEQLPSDIRTPNALLQTTNYLIRHILGGNEPLGIIHKFVWDRTRSVRNDFSVQQLTQESDVKIAVTCLERIARFHIISHHILSSPENEEPFEHHQEREQLNNTMLSLMYYYDDNRGRIDFPNEDEFRAYHIILSIHDQRPDLEARVSRWPTSLLTSPRVKVALDLYAAACNTWEPQATLDVRRTNAIAQGFYARFFNIINSPSVSYLMACVAEIYFIDVRKTALRSIWNGYWRPPSKSNPDQMQSTRKEEWMMSDLTNILHFDNDEQTVEFCQQQNLPVGESIYGKYLNWNFRGPQNIFPSGGREHTYSESCVEFKRAGRSLIAVILGMSVQEAARTSMIDKFELHARQEPSSRTATGVMDNNMDMEVVPTTEPENPTFISDQLVDSSASSTPNPFQNAFSTGNNSPLGSTQIPSVQPSMPTSQPSNLFQPSQSPNPFASMFPASTETNKPVATPTPPPKPSPDIKEASFLATFTPQPVPAPLFQTTKPLFPSTETKDTSTQEAPSQASGFKPASPFNFSAPTPAQTSTPTTTPTPTPSTHFFPTQSTSAQSSQSLFQPSPVQKTSPSLFQPAQPKEQPKEQPLTASSLFPSAPPTTTSPFSTSTSGDPAATPPSIFTPPPAAMPPPAQPTNSMFQFPAPSVPAKEQAKESNIFSQSESKPAFAFSQPVFAKPPVESSAQSQSHVSMGTTTETSQQGLNQPTPSFSASLPAAEPSKSSGKQPWQDGPLMDETEEDRQAAWRRLLGRVSEKHERQKRQSLIKERENEITGHQPPEEGSHHQESVQGSPKKRAWRESFGSVGREMKQLKVSDLVPISSSNGSASTIDDTTKAPTKAPAEEPAKFPDEEALDWYLGPRKTQARTLDDFLKEGILSPGMKFDEALDELSKKGHVRQKPTEEELDRICDQHIDEDGVFRIGRYSLEHAPWNDPVEQQKFLERQRRMRAEIQERERKEFEDYMRKAKEARELYESGSILDPDFSTLPDYLTDPKLFRNKDSPDLRYVRPWNATWEDFRTENWVADDEEYDYTTSLGRALAFTDKTVRRVRAYYDERCPGWDAEWNPNRRPNRKFNMSRMRHNASIKEPLLSESLRPVTSQNPFTQSLKSSTSQSSFSQSEVQQSPPGQDPFVEDQK